MDKVEKLNQIDDLLKYDLSFENYVKEIEKKQVDIPSDLSGKILFKINKKKKSRYVDICKIVACLIFSLAICRTDFVKNDEILKCKDDNSRKSIVITERLSDFCKWFTTPIEIEKEEK